MAVGDVYRFVSDQATGYESKPKLHVSLGATDHFRAPAEFPFLFISSSDYDSCFPIALNDYGEFLTHDSYVSCGKLVYYSFAFLKSLNLKAVGRLTDNHLAALRNHLADHDVMVRWEIAIACEALKDFVANP
ncbi:MAG: hypothetical protein BGO81_11035 [Devosia sp. 66-22]|nr:MAG: hypothetical protein BGO81_11035 [Devosia sp. 66-22]